LRVVFNNRVAGAIAFTIPVLIGAALSVHTNYLYLAVGPLCGIAGGLAYGRRWGLPIVLTLCFSTAGILFGLQDARSPWFSDVVWFGLVSGFLFWCIGACAVLVLPSDLRFRGAMAFALPGGIAGIVFQFLYGPAHFLFDMSSISFPWEQLLLWLIAGAGTGWLLGRELDGRPIGHKYWALLSAASAGIGMITGLIYFFRYRLPFGLFNSLSPSTAASDWLFGWSVLAGCIAIIALAYRFRRPWAVAGITGALILLVASYRVDADPWKTRFNASYADRLLREHGQPGDPEYPNAVYTGNLILAQTALEKNDVDAAKNYFLAAIATPGTRSIQQNGIDTSVARVLLQRGERDAVLEYFKRGRNLWPQGAQLITRWEATIRAGRMPNFNRGQGQN
jgi:hypothetical protein